MVVKRFDCYFTFPERPARFLLQYVCEGVSFIIPIYVGGTDEAGYCFMFVCQVCRSPHVGQMLWRADLPPMSYDAHMHPVAAIGRANADEF